MASCYKNLNGNFLPALLKKERFSGIAISGGKLRYAPSIVHRWKRSAMREVGSFSASGGTVLRYFGRMQKSWEDPFRNRPLYSLYMKNE